MKAQLAHLKALMEEATRDRQQSESEVEQEAEEEVRAEPLVNSSRNSIDRQSEPDESLRRKSRNSVERPTVDQVQVSIDIKKKKYLEFPFLKLSLLNISSTRLSPENYENNLFYCKLHAPNCNV